MGVVGGDGSLDSDSLGNRRFFGGATMSEIGGESENNYGHKYTKGKKIISVIYLADSTDYRTNGPH